MSRLLTSQIATDVKQSVAQREHLYVAHVAAPQRTSASLRWAGYVNTRYSTSLGRRSGKFRPQMKQTKAEKRAKASKRAQQNRGNRKTSSNTVSRQKNPSMEKGPDGSTRIRHRELISDVSGGTSYNVTGFSINPGLGSSFPWLSSVAERYESYVFNSLKFEYMHQVSEFTEGNGKVLLAVDYDAADSAPTSKVQMSSYASEVSCAPYENVTMTCKKSDLTKFGVQRYIRQGTLSSNLDIKTYDVGKFFIATQGQTGTSLVGELYVDYDIMLYTPQLSLTPVSGKRVGVNPSKVAPIHSDDVQTGNLPVNYVDATTISIGRAGMYLFEVFVAGTGLTDFSISPSTLGTVSALVPPLPDGAATSMVASFSLNVPNPGLEFVVDAATGNTTVTGLTIRMAQYDAELL